jgi:chromosome segregation ATPase
MDGSATPTHPLPSFRSPPRILIPKLVRSRDRWKAKAAQRKRDLKAAQIRTRDLASSRQRWKARALGAEQQLQDLQRQLQDTQRLLEQARAEIDQLQEQAKKK